MNTEVVTITFRDYSGSVGILLAWLLRNSSQKLWIQS